MTKKTKIGFVVIGPDQLMRNLLCMTLPLVSPGMHCLTDIDCGNDALALCHRLNPQIILFDLPQRSTSGLGSLSRLINHNRNFAIMIITEAMPEYLIQQMIQRKGCGMISRNDNLDTLGRASLLVAEGGTYVAASLHSLQSSHAMDLSLTPFSPRERHVLQLIAEGYSTKQVADLLSLSCKTVEKYRTGIMQKINVHDVVRLTHYAFKTGLIQIA